MKALSLFSGGLDSCLAIKIIQEQGIDVIPLNFVSYFFGGSNEKIESMCKQIGVKAEYIDFKEAHLKLIKNPPNGFGKLMNPCIDCHALMIKTALNLLPEYNASFVITGEVLGQRPMSQTRNSIYLIDKLTGKTGLVVRPLSAKLLPETIPEKEGWISREKLLDISGRGRLKQMELANKYGIKEYPTPAGGCLLTVEGYSHRLKVIREDNFWDNEKIFEIIKYGRFLRIRKSLYVTVGRNENENIILSNYKNNCDYYIIPTGETFGPHILVFGKIENENEKNIIISIFSKWSKYKGEKEVEILFNNSYIKYPPIDKNINFEQYIIY